MTHDTIAAISTPPGEGGIAVVRISGPDAHVVLGRVFQCRTESDRMTPRKLYKGRVVAEGEVIDDAMAVRFFAPQSYSGEPMAEIHGHGGVLVSAAVLGAVLAAGARAARPGEFTFRAFLNGKMDLTRAEAVMDLIHARTPLALRAAGEQLEGRIGRAVEDLIERLLHLVAHIEASIDFPDEGIDPDTGNALRARILAVRAEVGDLLATADEGRILREGVRLAIIGRPNAGKSSLLNRLLGIERAIVSPVAGTTRDTIEESLNLRGIPFRVVDTAGLRETEDPVEIEGTVRARRAAEDADIVLHVVGADVWPDAGGDIADPKTVRVLNKCDLPAAPDPRPSGWVAVSCLTGEGMGDLVDALVAKLALRPGETRESLAAINRRHQVLLERAAVCLDAAAALLEKSGPPEFVAEELRAALAAIGDVVGPVDTEDVLDRIFGSFCIGK